MNKSEQNNVSPAIELVNPEKKKLQNKYNKNNKLV
jgi:hypothetical protein